MVQGRGICQQTLGSSQTRSGPEPPRRRGRCPSPSGPPPRWWGNPPVAQPVLQLSFPARFQCWRKQISSIGWECVSIPGAKTEVLFILPSAHNLVQTVECTRADKQNIGCVNLKSPMNLSIIFLSLWVGVLLSMIRSFTWTVSPRVFLAAFFSGTLTVVPSTIFNIPCCTPSPSVRGGIGRCKCHEKRNGGRIAKLSHQWMMRLMSKFYLPHPSAGGCQGRLQFCQPEIIDIQYNFMKMDRFGKNRNGSY